MDTVYFGGGTPTMLGADRLCTVLEGIRQRYDLAPDAEITLEANPIAITPRMAAALRQGGFNRISMGLQSASPAQLRDLGRTHTAEKAAEAVRIVRAAGFRNLSLDLMLGLPHQTVEEVLGSIRFAAELGAVHLSAYMLQLEEGTPYAARYTESDIDEETQRQIYLAAIAELERLGFHQYEISNFARPGFESRHNLRYWRCEEYLGLGPGAHSFLEGRRFYYPRDLAGFLMGKPPAEDGPGGDFGEFAMLNLRLTRGLCREDCLSRFGEQGGALFDQMREKAKGLPPQLLRTEEGRLAFTPEGFLVSNALLVALE